MGLATAERRRSERGRRVVRCIVEGSGCVGIFRWRGVLGVDLKIVVCEASGTV